MCVNSLQTRIDIPISKNKTREILVEIIWNLYTEKLHIKIIDCDTFHTVTRIVEFRNHITKSQLIFKHEPLVTENMILILYEIDRLYDKFKKYVGL